MSRRWQTIAVIARHVMPGQGTAISTVMTSDGVAGLNKYKFCSVNAKLYCIAGKNVERIVIVSED